MKIYKFGGASIKDADGVRNLAQIVRKESSGPLVVVVSAMGKTTNALEKVHRAFIKLLPEKYDALQAVQSYHTDIATNLFPDEKHEIHARLGAIFSEIKARLGTDPSMDRDFEYDQIIPAGELMSSVIVHAYLNACGIPATYIDIRNVLKTDSAWREAKVDYPLSEKLTKEAFKADGVYTTQGFIGSSIEGKMTSLGREGSDYTAALLAYFLDAADVTIWKDVPGILNADPRIFPDAIKLDKISYKEAIELAYYGAQVIHPKTIKPLQNKNISLYVKPFLDPSAEGSVIYNLEGKLEIPPIYIIKKNQVLISISPKDFSFIVEENLSQIFASLAKHRIRVNLMQNSAISFSVVAEFDESKVHLLIGELRGSFKVLYNQDLELVTIRHYTPQSIEKMTGGRSVLLQQRSRLTARYVLK